MLKDNILNNKNYECISMQLQVKIHYMGLEKG